MGAGAPARRALAPVACSGHLRRGMLPLLVIPHGVPPYSGWALFPLFRRRRHKRVSQFVGSTTTRVTVAWRGPEGRDSESRAGRGSFHRGPTFKTVELTPSGDHMATLELEVTLEELERFQHHTTREAKKRVPRERAPGADYVNRSADRHRVAGDGHSDGRSPIGTGGRRGGRVRHGRRRRHLPAAASSSVDTAAAPAGVSEKLEVFTCSRSPARINPRSRSVKITFVAYLPIAAASSS